MRRQFLLVIGCAAALAGAMQIGQPTASVDDKGLVVAWNDTASPLEEQTYVITGEATTTYGCFANGIQTKQVTWQEPVKSTVLLKADASGKVIGRSYVTIPSLGSRLVCPGGQTPLVSSVSYARVVLMNQKSEATHRFEGEFAKVFRPINN